MQHELYETKDETAGQAIRDQNGDVCLAQCKVCGLGEIELEHRPKCLGRSLTSQERELLELEVKGLRPHDWVQSTLGHGEAMCSNCKITNREAAAIGSRSCGI